VDLRNIVPRAKFDLDSVVEVVRPIVEDVRERGVVAVQEWSAKFDGVTAPEIRVPQAVIDDALSNVDQKIRAALEEAIRDTCTEFDIATILYQLYKDSFVCVDIKSARWFQYVNQKWEETDSGTELRKQITNIKQTIFQE
jgi:hypothetical protein